MQILSYNVNGIRASVKLGLKDWLSEVNADVVCLQEVRANEKVALEVLFGQSEQISLFDERVKDVERFYEYYAFCNSGEKAGYAGTLILTKTKPDVVYYDMGDLWNDNEGRTTTIVLGDIAIVNTYVPNGGTRLDFKMQYFECLTQYLISLKKQYHVICVGDFNIAHNEIDLTNPVECSTISVFLPMERNALSKMLDNGFVDSFRHLYPSEIKYSWRSYSLRKGYNYDNFMYRMDYAIISASLIDNLVESTILDEPYSDHLPILLTLNI